MPTIDSARRLTENARRRLGALGVSALPREDGTLEAVLPGPVRDPLGAPALVEIRFLVEGHDRLQPVAPRAVDGLAAIAFLDLKHPAMLVAQLEQRLQERLHAAQAAMSEMRRLRLAVQLDPQRLRAVGRLELTSLGAVILEGDERGVRAVRLEPLHEGKAPIEMNERVDLREHQHRIDLELQLFAPAEKALKTPVRPRQRLATPAVPAGRGTGVTLGELVEKFGADACLEPGLALSRELRLGGQDLRFTARWDPKGGFTGELSAAAGTLWEGGFDLGRFTRVEELAASHLGVPPPPALPVTLGPAAAITDEMLDGMLRPVPGEIWLMSILLASEANGAIRYVPVDIDGKPFGEPRTISRADFDATFERSGSAGYRLLAKVLQVSDSHVTWVQLDPRRTPVGKPKSGALGMFTNHFVPAAAAY